MLNVFSNTKFTMLKNIIILTLLILYVQTSKSQNLMENKTLSNINPLLCDPELGICELPTEKNSTQTTNIQVINKPIKVLYFTDPICSSCWGIEPQLRKLKLEYGDYLDIEYRMGGLLPDWSYNSGGISKPSDVAHHWDEVSVYYQMPIDGDVWLEDPLPSSYPPSIAFKAAELQDKQKAITFLRKIREMVFLEKKNITKWEHISKAALLSGLDTIQLKADYESKGQELFEKDLALARELGVRGFPTMFFIDESNNQVKVYGSKPYTVYKEAVLKLKRDVNKTEYSKDFDSLFKKYATLTTKEYSLLKEITFEEAEKELTSYHQHKKINSLNTKNGYLWFK